MRVFKITGKSQQNRRYSDLPEDFKGYFVLDNYTHIIKGYLKEQSKSSQESIRYIYGIYHETDNQLVFFKMSNECNLTPVMYVFPDLYKEGVWSRYNNIYARFFPFGYFDGLAKIKIEEITENVDALSKKTLAIYSQVQNVGLKLNLMLLDNMSTSSNRFEHLLKFF